MGSHWVSGHPQESNSPHKHSSLQSRVALCRPTVTVCMFTMPRRGSQPIPGDTGSPTHTSQARGWPQLNCNALMKMLKPKGQPDPSLQPPACSSKFMERLEEHPRGQNCRVHQAPRQSRPATRGCPADAKWQRSHLLFHFPRLLQARGSQHQT